MSWAASGVSRQSRIAIHQSRLPIAVHPTQLCRDDFTSEPGRSSAAASHWRVRIVEIVYSRNCEPGRTMLMKWSVNVPCTQGISNLGIWQDAQLSVPTEQAGARL